MNIDSVVLVRAYKDFIPFNKELNPSCEEKYLHFDSVSDYKDIMKQKFIEEYKKRNNVELNIWNENDREIVENGLKGFMPLTSTYVSTLSFSINGLVADDMNNFFSEYGICVLEPLKDHIDDDFMSFNVNDTTIKGGIVLKDNAMLVINEDIYNKLTENEKNKLNETYKVNTFTGSLKEAVDKTLQSNGYPSLDITSRREESYIKESSEKESAISFIDNFAKEKDISTLRLFDIYTSPFLTENRDVKAQEKVADEVENINLVKDYYTNNFNEFLVSNARHLGMNISEEDKIYMRGDFLYSKETINSVVDYLLSKMSFEEYMNLVSSYNADIINNYKTNNEIVEMETNRKKTM